MKRLFYVPVVSICFFMLMSCAPVTVPQMGGEVPCQIQSVEQVEQAILAGLAEQHWEILSASIYIAEARKKFGQQQAIIEIAYGYRGFSIEYQSSQNMGYDIENDTIGKTYVQWVNALNSTIREVLELEVERNPPVICHSKNTPQ